MVLFAESFQTTVSVFGNLDIVINNAGIMNDRFWELEVDINLVSTNIISVNKIVLFDAPFACFCVVYISVSKLATLFGLIGVYDHTSAGLLTNVFVLCLMQAEETAHLLLLKKMCLLHIEFPG